jgi:hypothetical protein
MCMDIDRLSRALAGADSLRTQTFMRLAYLALHPRSQTAWNDALKDARDAEKMFKEAEAKYDDAMNELFPN